MSMRFSALNEAPSHDQRNKENPSVPDVKVRSLRRQFIAKPPMDEQTESEASCSEQFDQFDDDTNDNDWVKVTCTCIFKYLVI